MSELPAFRVVDGVQVAVPLELAAMKVMAIAKRAAQPKGDTDRADLRRLLLAFPELREPQGAVLERLRARGAEDRALALWHELAREPLEPDDEDSY